MAHLVLLVAAIAVVDSVNPSTIGPALVLAAADGRAARVRRFALGVFAVYTAGGFLLVLGPGQLLLAELPKPDHTAKHLGELVAGVVLLLVAAALALRRRHLATRPLPAMGGGHGAFALGATIMAVELPTAFPYFAAIAAIVDSGTNLGSQLLCLLLFNVIFVMPLVAIVAALNVAGRRADERLARGRDWFERRWPELAAAVLTAVGVLLAAFGGVGLA